MATFNSTNISTTLNSKSFNSLTLDQQSRALAEYGYKAQIEGIKNQKRAANLQRQANYQATIEKLQAAQFNIDSAKLNADTAIENQKFVNAITTENVKRLREENKKTVGTIKSRLAANGIDVSQGSSIDFLLEQAKQGELKAKDQILAGEIQARAYGLEAEQYLREKKRNEENATNIRKAYDINVGTIALGGQATDIASLPSLLKSYQAMNSANQSSNSLKSLLGY